MGKSCFASMFSMLNAVGMRQVRKLLYGNSFIHNLYIRHVQTNDVIPSCARQAVDTQVRRVKIPVIFCVSRWFGRAVIGRAARRGNPCGAWFSETTRRHPVLCGLPRA
jgi:hypothetical protein